MAEPKNDILEKLTDVVNQHNPYAVMGLDTIEKDNSREIFHVVIQNFTYSDASSQYEMEDRLELMQKCSKEIAQNDLERFGIADTYKIDALDSMDFSNRLTTFVLDRLDDSMLIVIGNDVVVNSLQKVEGCETLYQDKNEKGLALNSSSLIGAYLKEHDAQGDTPRAYLKYTGTGKVSAVTCDEKIAAVSSLVKRCSEEYGTPAEKPAPAVQEQQPVNEMPEISDTAESFDDLLEEMFPEQPSIPEKAPVAPVSETPPYQRPSHIEMKFTPEEKKIMQAMDEADKQRHEAYVEKGKKEYKGKTAEEKVQFLIDKKIVADRMEDMTELQKLHRMFDMQSRDSGNAEKCNGFTVLQAGSTGFSAGDKVTQVAFATYTAGNTGMKKSAGFSRLTYAGDMASVQKAEELAKSGGFDTFAHGGIDLQTYKELCRENVNNREKNFCTIDNLGVNIAKYFAQYPVEKYPIISAGTAKKDLLKKISESKSPDAENENAEKHNMPKTEEPEIKGISYSQAVLLQSVNHVSLTSECIDFAQVIKEYTVASSKSKEYNGVNVLFPPDGKLPEYIKDFSLESIAEQNGRTVVGSAEKCAFMAEMVERIQQQYLAMERQKTAEQQAVSRADAIRERSNKAAQRNQEKQAVQGYQEETFERPQSQDKPVSEQDSPAVTVPEGHDDTQSGLQTNSLNQNIQNLNAMARNITESLTAPQITYEQILSAIQRQINSIDNLTNGIGTNNDNISQMLIALNTAVGVMAKAINQKDKEISQILEVLTKTQEELISVNARISQTQEQSISIIETQNTNAKTTNSLMQEVASVKADGAETKESLMTFREETKASFDRTSSMIASHDTAIRKHEAEIANVKAEVREHRAEIGKLHENFAHVVRNSETTIQIVKSANDQLGILSENQNALAKGFVGLSEQVDVLHSERDKAQYRTASYEQPVIPPNQNSRGFEGIGL